MIYKITTEQCDLIKEPVLTCEEIVMPNGTKMPGRMSWESVEIRILKSEENIKLVGDQLQRQHDAMDENNDITQYKFDFNIIKPVSTFCIKGAFISNADFSNKFSIDLHIAYDNAEHRSTGYRGSSGISSKEQIVPKDQRWEVSEQTMKEIDEIDQNIAMSEHINFLVD